MADGTKTDPRAGHEDAVLLEQRRGEEIDHVHADVLAITSVLIGGIHLRKERTDLKHEPTTSLPTSDHFQISFPELFCQDLCIRKDTPQIRHDSADLTGHSMTWTVDGGEEGL